MYPERDSRADEFDAAIERRRTGDNTPLDDQELEELVNLASRLQQDLPDDLPDPAFRSSLRQELLYGGVQPGEFQDRAQEPVNLDEERWYRRIIGSPWRASAAAAACMGVLVVAFVMTSNLFGSGSGDSNEDVTSFQPVDADDTDSPDDALWTNQFPFDSDDGTLLSEQWFATSFPPFDVENVVLPPLLVGFLPLTERHQPQVSVNGVPDVVDNVDMPSNGTVYYLNAPPDGATMLTTLRSILGVDGELVEGNGPGDPYRIVDGDDNEILRWDPTSAFFHFQGDFLDEPLDDLLDRDATPSETARRFLELIGFDLYTIEYEEHAVENDSMTEVQFRPQGLPATALDVTLGGSVFIDGDGAVIEAQLYWLSLLDVEVVALRDPDEIIQDVEHDAGYSPPAPGDADEMQIDVEDVMVVHVLTRHGESAFVLQPAVKLVGDYGGDVVSMLPGPARYFVPAVASGD